MRRNRTNYFSDDFNREVDLPLINELKLVSGRVTQVSQLNMSGNGCIRSTYGAGIHSSSFYRAPKRLDKRKGIFLAEEAGHGATITYNESGENVIASNTAMSSQYNNDVAAFFFPDAKAFSSGDELQPYTKAHIDRLKGKKSNLFLLQDAVASITRQKGLSEKKVITYLKRIFNKLPSESKEVLLELLTKLTDLKGRLINIPVFFEGDPGVIYDFDAMYEEYKTKGHVKSDDQRLLLLSTVRVCQKRYTILRKNVEYIIETIGQQNREVLVAMGDDRWNESDVYGVSEATPYHPVENSSDSKVTRDKGYFDVEGWLSDEIRSRFSPHMQRYLKEFNDLSRACYSERIKAFVAIKALSPEEEKKRESYSSLTDKKGVINIPVTVHEYSYDLADVLRFIRDGDKCPDSGEEIIESDIEPNREMNEAIKEFLKEITDARREIIAQASSQLLQKQQTPDFYGSNEEEQRIRSQLSPRMYRYLKEEGFQLFSQGYSNRLEALIEMEKLSPEEEKKQDGYLDPITLNFINIPVSLYERCYNLDTLVDIIQKGEEGKGKCPYTGNEFTWCNIQPNRIVNLKIKSFLQEVMDRRHLGLDIAFKQRLMQEQGAQDACKDEESQRRYLCP